MHNKLYLSLFQSITLDIISNIKAQKNKAAVNSDLTNA